MLTIWKRHSNLHYLPLADECADESGLMPPYGFGCLVSDASYRT